jgi:hypothetical protein
MFSPKNYQQIFTREVLIEKYRDVGNDLTILLVPKEVAKNPSHLNLQKKMAFSIAKDYNLIPKILNLVIIGDYVMPNNIQLVLQKVREGKIKKLFVYKEELLFKNTFVRGFILCYLKSNDIELYTRTGYFHFNETYNSAIGISNLITDYFCFLKMVEQIEL